jgi:hypothetical protein
VKRLQAVIQPDDVILAVQRFVDDRKEGDAAGSNGRSASEERCVLWSTGRGFKEAQDRGGVRCGKLLEGGDG